ncbi:MAG: hypothetical protein Q8N23_10320 [Archangium sp.]|nr:hypothetical protein [Archangium sp.]MDP3153055.1 hypothetical protein [Archangium sp.]MDP3572558.1 hypothetical protein [Archangium sp.]
MRQLGVVVVLVVVCGVSASCVNTCIPGKTEACACTDGRVGAQICRGNGTFEPCSCTASQDAGRDGGDACAQNLNAPSINSRFIPGLTWRLAPGQKIGLAAQVQDFDRDPLTSAWSVHAEDAGRDHPVPNTIISPIGPQTVQITVSEPGRWVIELSVSDGCRETSHVWPIEVLPAKKLPFAVTDVVCCDASGRAFAIGALSANVMRLDMDGGVDATQALPRLPRRLSIEGSRLVVAQDAYVSFFRLDDFTLEAEWPVSFAVRAAIPVGDTAWVYGGSSQGLHLSIDAGTVLAQSTAERVDLGFVSADGGWLVVSASDTVEVLPSRAGLLRPFGGTQPRACNNLWATRDHSRFFTGCGDAWEISRDGGLSYAGTLREQTTLKAVTELDDSSVAVSYVSSVTEARLRIVNGSSLAVRSDFQVGLQSSDLDEVLAPQFLLPASASGVHALTPDPINDVTWWQEF